MRGPPRGGHRPFADYRIVVPEIEVSEDSYRVPPISDGADRWEEFSEVGHKLLQSATSVLGQDRTSLLGRTGDIFVISHRNY